MKAFAAAQVAASGTRIETRADKKGLSFTRGAYYDENEATNYAAI